MAQPQALMYNLPVNYGVELEFVFAFHESELKLGETDGSPNTLKKDLTYLEREEHPKFTRIPPVELPDHPYNSWAVLEGEKARPVSTILLYPMFISSRVCAN